jgi:hypothetical protein
MSYVIGLDLGQAADPSALAVLEREEKVAAGGAAEAHHACRALKRWPLGTSYPSIVKDVGEVLGKPGLGGAALVVDATGVGRPVVDLLRQANLPAQLVPVVITAGLSESRHDAGYWHVAKTVLISAVQVPLQQRRLKFARGLKETAVLVRELENYRTKITAAANETFSAREGEHDDLVLALALACWWGERMPNWGPEAFGYDTSGSLVERMLRKYGCAPEGAGEKDIYGNRRPEAQPWERTF